MRHARLLLVKGNALLGAGRNREARELYFQVYRACRNPEHRSQLQETAHKALMNAGLATRRLGEKRTALQFYREVLDRGLSFRPEEQVRMINLLASLHTSLGEHDKAEAEIARALGMAREIGLEEEQADLLVNQAVLDYARDRFPQALVHLEEARQLAGEDPERRLRIEFNMGTLLQEQQQPGQAWIYFDKAQDLARRHDLPHRLPLILGNMARIRQQEGQHGEAAALAQEALEFCRRYDSDNTWVRETCQEILKDDHPQDSDPFPLAETLIRSHGMVAVSENMRRIIREIEALAGSELPVMVIGETGTGKELVARALHSAGVRATAPFVPVNCPAIPEGLFESTLFGHVKGAFTGATEDRKGLVELAEKGSLFLDEIGDMPLSIQPKLLRFLETGEFSPMGSAKTRYSSARIISATNRDPAELVANGAFRKDLLMRISAFRIDLPPLQDRREDIYFIAVSELDRLNRRWGKRLEFSAEALQVLNQYGFPGNVRELKNAVARGAQVARREIRPQDMGLVSPSSTECPPLEGKAWPVVPLEEGKSLEETVRELEIRLIRNALQIRAGDRELAARDLGLSFRALKYKISKYGIRSRKQRGRSGGESEKEANP